MSWTEKYWDAIDQIYWWPQYIGLKSIPQKFWSIEGESVSIPKEMVNLKGPLYRRLWSGDNYWDYVRRKEEIFNQVFSLAFAILPADVIGDVFGSFTKAGHGHFYESLGRELRRRYDWGEHGNVTYPDCFFISERSILAVELKFNAKTSLDQLAKYTALLTAEAMLSSHGKSLDLLYVFNRDPVTAFHKEVGFGPNDIGGHLFDDLSGAVKNTVIRRFYKDHEEILRGTLDRIKISCISWQNMFDALLYFSDTLGDGRGERTLRRLIGGLMSEIERHPLSNVKKSGAGVA